MGHNFGRQHAGGCGSPEGVNDNIPHYIEDYGLNVETLEVKSPAIYADLMSYCENRWPTRHIYELVYSSAETSAHSASAASGSEPAQRTLGLLIKGTVDPVAGEAEIRRASLRLWPEGPFEHAGVGPYSLELQNAAQEVLFVRRFDLDMAIESGGEVVGYDFKQVLPSSVGIARVVLKHDTQVLTTLEVSDNAPEVVLQVPTGGEVITAPFEASWTGSDADSDSLTYSLQLSRDGGAGWLPLAVGMTETVYTLDPDRLPGGRHMRLRVIANDGARTGVAESEADFSLPNHQPVVGIARPTGEEKLSRG